MLNESNSTVNRKNKKNLKKSQTTHNLHTYKHENLNPVLTENKEIPSNTSYAYLGGRMLEARGIQKFNPHSLLDHTVFALVHAERKNWIVTLPGNRQKRSRDFQKKIFKKHYILRRHTFGTKLKVKDPSNAGYYRQAWYVGNPMTFEQDVIDARAQGPKGYYPPSRKIYRCIKIVQAVCREFELYYSHRSNYSQTMRRIRQSFYAINEHKRDKFDKYAIHCILNTIQNFLSIGHKNHIKGGCFGRSSGRPTKKTTKKQKRPYNFHTTLCSSIGRRIVSGEAIKICRELNIRCTPRILKSFHVEIRRYYWSERYIKNYALGDKASTLDVIQYCIKNISYDLFLIAKYSYVHNHVHGSVSNENKTGHYYSPFRGITLEIDISKSKRHYPPPENKIFNSFKGRNNKYG